jgi:hypothetical protein
MRDQLRVAVRLESMSFGFEKPLGFRIVEQLAVEDRDDAVVLVRHRLTPVGQSDNAQPSVDQPDAVRLKAPFVVRASVQQRIGHLVEDPHRIAWLPERSMRPAMPHIGR